MNERMDVDQQQVAEDYDSKSRATNLFMASKNLENGDGTVSKIQNLYFLDILNIQVL